MVGAITSLSKEELVDATMLAKALLKKLRKLYLRKRCLKLKSLIQFVVNEEKWQAMKCQVMSSVS